MPLGQPFGMAKTPALFMSLGTPQKVTRLEPFYKKMSRRAAYS